MAVISASKVEDGEAMEPKGEGDPAADGDRRRQTWPRRRTGVAAGALALVCIAAAYGAFGPPGDGGSEDDTPVRAAPTAEVTYEVTGDGAAEITFRPTDGTGAATVVRDAALPWRKSVRLPVGTPPTVVVVLGAGGGTAACTVTIRGEHVQRALATGRYGRATCGGERGTARNRLEPGDLGSTTHPAAPGGQTSP
ncbi:hypothetical protein ACH4E8_01910 [Streptomyces sp. NPDC017979]|uniref:hypothetical protein n=1 Tax=Streptomyces sp. NPDC017979 TaxID=3365024 RepID=UPI00379238FB